MDGNGTFTHARPRQRSRAARIGLGILVGVVAGNAVAAGTYLAINGIASERTAPPMPSTPQPSAASTAHRNQGLEAMDRGNYGEAVNAFLSALRSPNPSSDLPQLLKLARALQEKAERPSAAEASSLRTQEAPPPSSGSVGTADQPPPRIREQAPSEADASAEVEKNEAPRRAATVRASSSSTRVKKRRVRRSSPKPRRAKRTPDRSPSTPTSAREPEPAAAKIQRETPSKDELPLCPKEFKPAGSGSPYAVLPRRCRPRTD